MPSPYTPSTTQTPRQIILDATSYCLLTQQRAAKSCPGHRYQLSASYRKSLFYASSTSPLFRHRPPLSCFFAIYAAPVCRRASRRLFSGGAKSFFHAVFAHHRTAPRPRSHTRRRPGLLSLHPLPARWPPRAAERPGRPRSPRFTPTPPRAK